MTLDQLTRVCPAFTPCSAPIRTATSLLQPGSLDGQPVIAKQPIDPRPWWHDRCRHEITVYRAFQFTGPPPVPVPTLVAADPDIPLLVLTTLPGEALHPDRYPARGTFPPKAARRLLATLRHLHEWSPSSARAFPDDSDYPNQLASIPSELLDAAAVAMLTELHRRAGTRTELSHGDAHPGNARADRGQQLALLDFEFTAWRPAGYDHAKLFVFLADNPAARAAVLHDLQPGTADQAGFWIAVVLVTCRELISHRRHPDLPHRDVRLAQLTTDLRNALAQTHRLHQQLPPTGGTA
ncbi:phosphotransferase [Actinoplanes sp. NPDC051851]|uniref:phosphotransferase n=1 Tax=Actinoplanes sp. NPDC051851 TaxID=3154753 RepID=UPI00342EC06F